MTLAPIQETVTVFNCSPEVHWIITAVAAADCRLLFVLIKMGLLLFLLSWLTGFSCGRWIYAFKLSDAMGYSSHGSHHQLRFSRTIFNSKLLYTLLLLRVIGHFICIIEINNSMIWLSLLKSLYYNNQNQAKLISKLIMKP